MRGEAIQAQLFQATVSIYDGYHFLFLFFFQLLWKQPNIPKQNHVTKNARHYMSANKTLTSKQTHSEAQPVVAQPKSCATFMALWMMIAVEANLGW